MRLFVFGLGVTALAFVEAARARGGLVSAHGTVRSPGKATALARSGITAHLFDAAAPPDGAAREAIEAIVKKALATRPAQYRSVM